MKINNNNIKAKVKELQIILGLKIDGEFAKITHQKVIKFQNENNLITDGIVGFKTWSKIIENHGLFEEFLLKPKDYVQESTSKTSIYLHHTLGWHNPYNQITGWSNDLIGAIATEWVIGGQSIKNNDNTYDGKIIRCIPASFWAYHLGVEKGRLCKNSTGIELCNFGQLEDFKTWAGQEVNKNQIIKLSSDYRSYKYFHKYSNKQLEATKDVLLFLSQRDNIDLHDGLYKMLKSSKDNAFNFNQNVFNGKIKGILTHGMVRKDKFDVFPQDELCDMILSL